MARRVCCHVLLIMFIAVSIQAQQTIYFKKDHIYNGPNGKEIAVVMPQPTDQTAPTAPTNLTVGTVTATSAQLSWSGSSDSGGSGLAGYKLYRTLSAGGANLPVGTVGPGTLSFTDQGPLVPSTSYSYTAVAYDNAENHSSPSNSVLVTTNALSNSTPPTTPSGLVGYLTARNTVQLSWNPSVDTGGSGMKGYNVYRGGTLISGGTPIANASYTDANLAYNTMYSYSVTAVDNSNNVSSASSLYTITTGHQLLFQDNFNRADGALGSPWTFNVGAGPIDLYNDYTNGSVSITQLQAAAASCNGALNCTNSAFNTYYFGSGQYIPAMYPIIVWHNAALQPSQNTFQATVTVLSNNSYAGLIFYAQSTTGGFNDPGGGGSITYPSANGYRAVLENGSVLVQSCMDLSYPINTTDVCTTVASATGMAQTGTLMVQTNAGGTVNVFVNGVQKLSFTLSPSRMTGGVGITSLESGANPPTLGTFVLEAN